jgi:hypothetical protein
MTMIPPRHYVIIANPAEKYVIRLVLSFNCFHINLGIITMNP